MIEDDELNHRIKQVQDMGFEYHDALSALEVNNYNINEAVEYLFMDHNQQIAHREAKQREDKNLRQLTEDSESSAPQSSESHVNIPAGMLSNIEFPPVYHPTPGIFHYRQTVDLDNCHPQPPPLPSRTWSSQHIENAGVRYTTPDYTSDSYAQPNAVIQEYEIPVEAPPYSIYDDVERYQRQDEAPSVLMPLRNGQYEGYLNALLTMVHEIPQFRKTIFKHEFETLGFHTRWFKGDDINIPPSASIVKDEEGKDHDLRFLLETQRLFGFLSGVSGRAFASSKNFIKSFPRAAQQKLGEVESLNDAYDVFYHTLVDELKVIGVKDGGIGFFENSFKYMNGDKSGQPSKIGMIAIDSDDWAGSFHKSLTSLMSEHQHDGTIAYIDHVSDLLTVAIDPVFGTSMANVELEQFVYPQIYTPEFFDILEEVRKRAKEAKEEHTNNSQRLMNLKQHQGKQVGPALDSSIEFIQLQMQSSILKEEDASLQATHELLLKVKENSQNLREHLLQRNEVLLDDIQKYDVNNVETLLNMHGNDLEPYVLIGIIFNQDQFAYLKKVEGDLLWVGVEHESRSSTSFKIRPIKFEELNESAKMISNQLPTSDQSLVMVYVRNSLLEESLGDEDIEVPKSVLDFIQKDREELEKTLELLESDTEPELLEYDEDAVQVQEDDDFDEIKTESKDVGDDSSADLIDLDTPEIEKSKVTEGCSSAMSVDSEKKTIPSTISLDDGWIRGAGSGSPISIDEEVKIPDDFSPTMSTGSVVDDAEKNA